MFAAMYLAEIVTLRVMPIVAIALLNALIVSRVTRITHNRKRRRRHIPLLPVDANTATGCLMPAPSIANDNSSYQPQQPQLLQQLASVNPRPDRRASLDERNLQLTIILILVSTTYILFYLPVLVHFVMFKMKRSDIVQLDYDFLDVFGNYAKALHVAGFAINFILYTLSGRVFREQLVTLLRRCRCRLAASEYKFDRPGLGRTTTTNVLVKLSAI